MIISIIYFSSHYLSKNNRSTNSIRRVSIWLHIRCNQIQRHRWCYCNGLPHVITCWWCCGNGLSPHVFTCWWCYGNGLMCSPSGGALVMFSIMCSPAGGAVVMFSIMCSPADGALVMFSIMLFPGSSSSLTSCGGCACGRCSCWMSTTSSSNTPAKTWSRFESPTPHR